MPHDFWQLPGASGVPSIQSGLHSTGQGKAGQGSTVSIGPQHTIGAGLVLCHVHCTEPRKQVQAEATHSDWQYFCLAQAGHWA
jgi:hypothetical protein